MGILLRSADDILRRAPWTTSPLAPGMAFVRLIVCVAVFAGLYGGVMGLYRGMNGQGGWVLQVAFSGIKAPMLLLGAFAVSLPSFFVFSTLFGLRQDFARAVRALVAAQAGLAITLASLAPFTVLFYASTRDYRQALLFNGAMFAIASLAGHLLLRIHFRPLIARNPRHRQLLLVWGVAYVFVAIQLAWLLRPFIGSHSSDVTFLRPEAWDNAYVVVLRLVWRGLFGG